MRYFQSCRRHPFRSDWASRMQALGAITHLKFNIAPEKLPPQKESNLLTPNHHFSGAMLNFGGVRVFFCVGRTNWYKYQTGNVNLANLWNRRLYRITRGIWPIFSSAKMEGNKSQTTSEWGPCSQVYDSDWSFWVFLSLEFTVFESKLTAQELPVKFSNPSGFVQPTPPKKKGGHRYLHDDLVNFCYT